MNVNAKKGIFILINIFLILLQVTVFPNFKIGWLNINFALIAVVFTALLTDGWLYLINGILVGFWYDIFASREMGFYTLMFICLAIAIKVFSKMINRYSFITGLVIIFASTFITEIITYWICFVAQGMEYNSFVLTKMIMPQALLNTAVSVILFWLYLWLIKTLDIKNYRR